MTPAAEPAPMLRSNPTYSMEGEPAMPSKYKKQGHADGLSIEYIDGLYGYALMLTRNRAEAEDLVQETYLRAIQALERLRADSNIKGWLFTILRNIWLNHVRKVRNAPNMVEFEEEHEVTNSVAETSRNAHDLYVSKTEAEQVRAAIEKLPVTFREIIVLREYEELSYQEIASVVGCPVGTVMSRLGRARAMLRIQYSATLKPSGSPK